MCRILCAVNWVLRNDTVDKTAWRISNAVTDAANEPNPLPPPGTPKTLLQNAFQISSGEYYLQVVVCT